MRIWVARPEPAASRTAERLSALGHAPLVAPVLAIAPTGHPIPRGPFDGLLLTSANAVQALAGGEWGADGVRAPVFAVGDRTASAARRGGLGPVLPADGDAVALARLVRDTLRPGAALLHVAGVERKAEPAASLEAAGYRVTTWIAYAAETVLVLPGSVAAALSGENGVPCLEGALHYSRRSAAVSLDLAVAAGRFGAFGALKHYCLSADVAAPLIAAGIAAHFVPARPNEDALLAGLAGS